MKVALVGPELEENLALRYIHAAVTNAGHEARIYDFHAEDQLAHVAMSIDAFGPDAVGLSMMFTARSREFVELAERLRALGYSGHITAGGHFASFHAERLLDDCPAIDSIVHGEGEEGMCELLDHLADLATVTGITWRDAGGRIAHNGYRSNLPDLDTRACPTRPDQFHTYMGLGIASLLAGRGCYANCNFCSINAWHRQSGGPRFRQREVEAIGHEMAELYHCRNVRIFNFQDDQFFLPTEKANLERLGGLERELERHGVGKIALQVKARPDSDTLPVISKLKAMGLFRVFLGVETNAVVGLETLGRGVQRQQNHLALDILRKMEVHTCFNLLIFDPESQFKALWENIEFLERQSYFPLNFCRVEVYAGTAIERRLREEGRLIGDYYGYTYEIANPKVQIAYEMFREVFTPRNFRVDGMNHQSMRADYYYHLLAHFHASKATTRTGRYVKGIVAELNRNNAELLGQICRFADSSDARSDASVRAETERQCGARVDFDYAMRPRIEALLEQMEEMAEAARRPKPQSRSKVANVAAAALLASTLGCGPKPETHMAEMAPEDPTLPVETAELTASQLARVQEQIRLQYADWLRDFARTHGLQGTQQQLELRIQGNGRLDSASLVARPDLDADLWRLVSDWEFPDVVRFNQIGTGIVVISMPAEPVETHMAEMAPPDPDPNFAKPPPDPPSVLLDANETRQLQQLIHQKHFDEMVAVAKKYGGGILSARVAIEFGPGGAVASAKVILADGVKKRRFERKLAKLVKKWKFPAYARGRKATVTLMFQRAKPIEDKHDTHMAEMAPRDPVYPKKP
jgi:radical SAM superfamily enzyme YgiQ (UPF0313 family)